MAAVTCSISLQKLILGDSKEIANLWHCCAADGCFHLDFADVDEGLIPGGVLPLVGSIHAMMDEFFRLPLEEKLQLEMNRWNGMKIGGYKPAGGHSGVVRGKRDGFENLLMPVDVVTNKLMENAIPWPDCIQSRLSSIRDMQIMSRNVCYLILASLSKYAAGFKDRLLEVHRPHVASTSTLAMLQYLPGSSLPPEQVGHMAHTDVGSLTLLFTDKPGLQIYHYAASRWVSVEPKPGCAFVNVGDTLRLLTKSKLRSCLHRVLPQQTSTHCEEHRKSIAFFLRPELSAAFSDEEGRQWSGLSWHLKKYQIFKADNAEQEDSSLLTGIKGFLGDAMIEPVQ